LGVQSVAGYFSLRAMCVRFPVVFLVQAFCFRERAADFRGPEKGERLFADKTKGHKGKKIIKTNIASGMLLRQLKGALSGKCYGSGQPNKV